MDGSRLMSRDRASNALATTVLALLCLAASGCKSLQVWRVEADRVADGIIERSQREAIRRTEPFTIETPADALRRRLLLAQGLRVSGPASLGTDRLAPVPHWPGDREPPEAGASGTPIVQVGPEVQITLLQALQIAARNNRGYQTAKEAVFIAALGLDLESQEFRNTYTGLLHSTVSRDESGPMAVGGVTGSGEASWSKRFRSGAALTGRLGIDLVKLCTGGRDSALGIFCDTSVSVPLLRGAGRHIVTEELTQAQREVIYALYALERQKRTLAVQVATDYLRVLQQLDQIKNATDNHDRLVQSAKRAERRGQAGREKKAQVDEAQQDVLRARVRVINARDSYQGQLDGLKLTLGLPTDARIALDPRELSTLVAPAEAAAAQVELDAVETSDMRGKLELPVDQAIELALTKRLDLRAVQGRVVDAQRGVVVAADGLKADLTLTATAALGGRRGLGSTTSAYPRPDEGVYSATASSDLPWERTAERNAFRTAYITLERAARSVQELEDKTKLAIRGALRKLAQTRKTFIIESRAVELALSRVTGTKRLFEAERVEIQEVLKAQESLVQAQDALTAALVSYRIAELELQRDMGVLEVDEKGLWREYGPQ